jgi:hypothetical protein
LRLDRLLDLVSSTEFFLGLLWGGLAALGLTLLLLIRTRWGQSRPVEKCLVLSLLVHLWLAGFFSTVKIVSLARPDSDSVTRVALTEDLPKDRNSGKTASPARLLQEKPWDAFAEEWSLRSAQTEVGRVEPKQPAEPRRQPRNLEPGLVSPILPREVRLVEIKPPEPKVRSPEAAPSKAKTDSPAEPIQAPAAQRRDGARATVARQPEIERAPPVEPKAAPVMRTTRTEIPSALLERPVSLPRLSNMPTSPEPQPALSGPSDSLSPAPAQPAKAVAATRSDAETPVGSDTIPAAAADAGDLKSPSMVANRPPAAMEPRGDGRPLVGPPQLPRNPRSEGDYSLPEVYRLRVASNRSQLSERLGATAGVETAVTVALKWLADNQEPDGHWSAKKHGAGRETLEGGRDRQAAGSQADSGVSGLAILAFAGSGNTHRDGLHRNSVLRGVEYLLRIQGADGNLGGDGQLYEFMYCHGMAALALSELAGMTGDQQLREPLARAVAYTLAAQDPVGGGWRYRPREAGDTSQLGWQLMVLKSAELAGISVPQSAWRNASRFLDAVSAGNHRGLASYRPDEEISHPMTAEALACRQFLGLARDSATAREAGDYLLGALPGEGDANLYYWYYASIAMYQLQGNYWKRWSEALQKTLLATQRANGPLAGSWDPTTRWDGYGGRVYSTALATLCLEAYYRFLPLNSAGAGATEAPGGR